MAGLASIFHSKCIQEILVSDWIIRSAHAQTGCLQMRSPALSKWQDLALSKIRYYKDVTLCENYVRDFFIAAILPVSVKFVI